MGCAGSKSTSAVAPMPVPEAWAEGQQGKVASPKGSGGSKVVAASVIRVKAVPENTHTGPGDSQYSSSESIIKPVAMEGRNGSARSADSGLGGEHADHVITEQSSPALKEVADIPDSKPDPDLVIDGKQMKTPGPIGHRKRSTGRLPPVHPGHSRHRVQTHPTEGTEEPSLESILEKHVQFADVLINELPALPSIVKRPVSRGGVAFDIGTDTQEHVTRAHARKPACVVKYSQHRRAAEVVTHAELDEKQKAADQRRKVRADWVVDTGAKPSVRVVVHK